MTYDILLEGHNGERLVDFAASDKIKENKVSSYINSLTGCSRQYNASKVVVRSRETNETIEEHELN